MHYSSRPGENVLDLFGGAAAHLNCPQACQRRVEQRRITGTKDLDPTAGGERRDRRGAGAGYLNEP